MHENKIMVRYVCEMVAALLFYALVLVFSIDVGRPMAHGWEQTLVEISPMLPVLVLVWVLVRQFRRVDEYIRFQALENLSIAAAVTAGWTFTYGFLENAGFPLLSMFNVAPVMAWVWGVLAVVRCLAGR